MFCFPNRGLRELNPLSSHNLCVDIRGVARIFQRGGGGGGGEGGGGGGWGGGGGGGGAFNGEKVAGNSVFLTITRCVQ